LVANGRLLLRFSAAVPVVREQHALQPLALVVANLHVFRAVAHSRVFTTWWFCLIFSKKFNIISALFVTNRPLAAKNRFSRKFVLMQNRVSMCMRQNEYLFKRTAICTTFGAICG